LYYLDSEMVAEGDLENLLKKEFSAGNAKTLVIRGDEQVSYKSIMYVMDIANRNKIKMILAVKAN
jgi:biopolymer transport protein ExbD